MQNLDPTKYGLAIHTTSPELGLALSNFAGDCRSQTWDLGRSLSTHLHQKLAEFIQPQTWTDLAFIAVAKGPGGFTGTRIGVVTARTLAQQLDIPLFALSSLASVAWPEYGADGGMGGFGSQSAEGCAVRRTSVVPCGVGGQRGDGEMVVPTAVQLAAQRGEVHAAMYQVSSDGSGLTPLLADTVLTLEKWQQTLTDWPTPYKLIQAEGGLGASALNLLELAYLEWQQGKLPHWSEALPFYGQHPLPPQTTRIEGVP